MIPVKKIETLVAFLGFILFIGTLKATLTTFDNNVSGAVSEGNLRIQLTTGFIYASIFALILLKFEKFLPFMKNNFLLFLFLLIPLFSIAWSVSPDATIRRAVALFGSSFFSFYLAFALPPERTLRILTAAYAVTAAASLVIVLLLPGYGTHQFGEYAGLWRGVFATKNELGAAMAMATILLLICPKKDYRERLAGRVMIALCLSLLLMSESRAAMVALLAVGVVLVPLRWISGHGLKTNFRATVMAILALSAVGGVVQYSEPILEFMGKDTTLTGRTDVWELAIERAKERPVLGYGFRAYWTPENRRRLRPTEDWSDRIGHAHNTYIDLMVELGLLGVCSFFLLSCILIMRIVRRIARCHDVVNVWAVSCITFIFVRGFAESTILQHADIHWFYFVYFFALLAPSRKKDPGQKPFFGVSRSLGPVLPLRNVTIMKAKDIIDQPYGQMGASYPVPGFQESSQHPGSPHWDDDPAKERLDSS